MVRKASLKTLRKRAWDACSLYVRQYYASSTGMAFCYTCGKLDHWKAMDAGHAIDGRSNAVLFDLEILRCQCDQCNRYKHGNHKVFTYKLIKEHSIEWWEAKLIHAKKIVKYNRTDYESLIQEFERKTEALKK